MGTFIRLISEDNAEDKRKGFFSEKRYIVNEKSFKRIPGNQYAYWISPQFLKLFDIIPLDV